MAQKIKSFTEDFKLDALTKTYHQSLYPAISPDNPLLSAAGKVILITGGGTGIGKATAATFVQAGAEAVIITGRRELILQSAISELSKLGKTKLSYDVADVTDSAVTEKVFASAIKTHGKVDVLIANAGYLDQHKSIVNSELSDYWLSFEINVKGLIILTQAFLKIAKPGATVVNISTAAGVIPYIPGFSAYSTSKIAGARFMEYLHHENPKLRVFNLQPGQIYTDMSSSAGLKNENCDDVELPGGVCLWFASPESEFMRGRFMFSNFDVEELKAKAKEIEKKNLLIIALNGWNTSS